MAKRKSAVKKDNEKFKAILIGERIVSNSNKAISLYEQSRFGELTEGRVYYSLIEAIYLTEKCKMEIFSAGKKFSHQKLLEKALKADKNFFAKYSVFRDMRVRGYIVKTALKFGADFRVYEKGVRPGEEHAKWILYPVAESSALTWHDFAAKNRVAHSTNKNLLIGIVDDEGDVTYYEIKWLRP